MLASSIGELANAHPFGAVPEIVFINILLSGDNALVIAMACRALPRRQRILGLAIGEAVAVVLLVLFAAVMARLLQFPYLKLAGGLALLYIAASLLARDHAMPEAAAATQLWRAVRIVVLADVVMSFDNVLAIVQVAGGDLVLLAIGLAISIPIVVVGAALITALLERLPILIWAGALLLGWVAGETIVGDPAIAPLLTHAFGTQPAGRVELTAACAGAVLVGAAGSVWRHRRRIAQARALASREQIPDC
ncbi:MAG: YjbE family putative metal transport protein [Xanthobacteraceae bacterium]